MIKAIIFDMGGVIIDYDPALYTRRVTADPEERSILENAVFHSPEWARLDEGTIELSEFDQVLRSTLAGELAEKAVYLLHHWYEDLPVFAGMERLMKHLYDKNIPLFLLSNAGQQFHIYSEKIPAFRYLNGIALSSDLKLMKPGVEIFEWLTNTFDLEPDECLFIDDAPANVRGAEQAGLHGYSYADGCLKNLCHYLAEIGILKEEEIPSIL